MRIILLEAKIQENRDKKMSEKNNRRVNNISSIEFDRLRKSTMLSCLDEKQWEHFKDTTRTFGRKYSKGQIIHLEGEICNSADFIVDGALHVKRHDVEGRTFMIERFKVGDLIGANLLFSSNSVYPMTIIAESDCEIASFSKSQLLSWCQSNVTFLESYLLEISDKTKVLVRAVQKISTGTLREKLLIYFDELLDMRNQNYDDERSGHNIIIEIPVSKKELAQRYGVARTSLSRELNRMEKDGLIRVLDKNCIELLDD